MRVGALEASTRELDDWAGDGMVFSSARRCLQ